MSGYLTWKHNNWKYGKQNIVSSNSPLEYAERFKARQMTKPNLVQFATGELDKVKRHSNSMRTSRRKIEGFFPPMKLRQNGKPLSPDMQLTHYIPPCSRWQLTHYIPPRFRWQLTHYIPPCSRWQLTHYITPCSRWQLAH
jgi:hypothetical protein